MSQVKQLLEIKGAQVYSVAPEAPVIDALRLMAERRVGALLVMRGDQLAGLVSERDYARKVILQNRSSSNSSVSDIMTSPAVTVGLDTEVEECMRLCTHSRIRHLPVVDNGAVVGVISIGDLVKTVIDEQAEHIEQLERYITT